MRVVAGSARGRRLAAPPGSGTRPTTDRVREAVFNALGSMGAVVDAEVLDAFAGSGALGIEALSRGAARCTFVEPDRTARAVVAANLEATRLEDRAEVLEGDVHRHLGRPGGPYDLVLCDPPRHHDRWDDLLAALVDRLHPGGVVVVEADRPVVGDDDRRWAVTREKRYGGTVVQMVSRRTPEAPR